MVENDTIDMVKCSYCEEEWVTANTEIVCRKCEPYLSTDIDIANLLTTISLLERDDIDKLKSRIQLLQSAHTKLSNLLYKIQ